MIVAALSSNQSAWGITLGAAVVVLIVVVVLLEGLRRAVLDVEQNIWGAWFSGKTVFANTLTSYLLKNTRSSGADLADELRQHL